MTRDTRPLTTAATLLLFLGAWELLSRSGVYSPHLFPPPSRVFLALEEWARSGDLWKDFRASAFRWAAGFLLGTAGGVLLGLLTGRVAWLRESLGQLLHFCRSTPFVVLIPLAILWFGIGETEKVLLVAWGVLFPVWVNTHVGVEDVEEEYVWAAQCLGMTGSRMFLEVFLPRATPFVVAGMRIGIATGTFALAAAEMAGAFQGLAHRIFYSHEMFQTEKMMAGVVLVGCLGFALDRIFHHGARRLVPWLERGADADE